MTLRYRLERRLAQPAASFLDLYEEATPPEWHVLGYYDSRPHPKPSGLVGSSYDGEQVRVMCDGMMVDLYQWSERIAVNPADLACTDFRPGWQLIERKDSPTPSADELAHFFMAG